MILELKIADNYDTKYDISHLKKNTYLHYSFINHNSINTYSG